MTATGALEVLAQAPTAPDGQSLTGDKCWIALVAITTARTSPLGLTTLLVITKLQA